MDDAAVQRAVEEVAAAVAHQETEPKMQHVMSHDLGHGEAVSYHINIKILNFLTLLILFCCIRVILFDEKFMVQLAEKEEMFTLH